MRIVIVGGGPAGLYFGMLMRKADPRHEITVIERNPPDATFGWGVVFSEETLGALRDADTESFDRITSSFARWNAIEILHRGETIRSRGHAFTGIARRRLLGILQHRCEEVGVALRFEEEVDDAFALDADLVIAADGVNSRTRHARAEAFGVSEHEQETKYVWLGADFAFKAFTFIFRETRLGMFQAHIYPFDANTSTFIVECHRDTWRRADLDRASEQETIDYCRGLFADELGGDHALMSNRSAWTSFVTLGCRAWRSGNVALMGDAAHTAHFSIGSGTKLAMEDAIALARALQRHKEVEPALTEYEMERQPVVERFQRAAAESASYFENVGRYARFVPTQFAFNLLTRSGRIGHTNLQLRDPDLVRRVDAWFAGESDAGRRRLIAPPPMFTPFELRGVRLSNRVALTPVGEDAAEDGLPGENHIRQLTGAAKSGAGLVITEMVAVSREGRITPGSAGMYVPEHIGAWSRIVWFVHELTGARIAAQLGHAGRRGSTRARRFGVDRPLRTGNWPLVSASALSYSERSQTPFELDRGEMAKVLDEFKQAVRMAEWAGFDALELNMAHGYLLSSFLSPLSNRRADEFGGALEDRWRFPLEVFAAARAEWPDDKPIVVSFSATDWAPGGFGPDDATRFAAELHTAGCDLIRVQAGQTTFHSRPDYGPGFLVPFSDRIRNEGGLPTLVGGGLRTADQVDTILAAGRADLCAMDLDA